MSDVTPGTPPVPGAVMAYNAEGRRQEWMVPVAKVERLREALDTLAHWRGTLTAADAGTMRATARAALNG